MTLSDFYPAGAILGSMLASTWYISAKIERVKVVADNLTQNLGDHRLEDNTRFDRVHERLDETMSQLTIVARAHLKSHDLVSPD